MDRIEELKALWERVFGDDRDYIDRFFDTFYSPDICAVCECDGKIAAAAYLMPVGDFVTGTHESVSCAHIYAVGVLQEYRGKGLGKLVTEKCVRLGEENGFGAIVLHPADERLFEFYRSLGFCTAFYIPEKEETNICDMLPVSYEEYMDLREEFLKDIPHIRINKRALSYFESQGGSFYSGENCCAALDGGDIKEYLYSGFSEKRTNVPFGMIYGTHSYRGYMGLAFD